MAPTLIVENHQNTVTSTFEHRHLPNRTLNENVRERERERRESRPSRSRRARREHASSSVARAQCSPSRVRARATHGGKTCYSRRHLDRPRYTTKDERKKGRYSWIWRHVATRVRSRWISAPGFLRSFWKRRLEGLVQ